MNTKMKKMLVTLALIAVCAASVMAQPRGYGYYGRHHHHGPRHGYVHYAPAPYHYGSFGSFVLGAAIGAVVDHAITKAVYSRPVVVEREVIVNSNDDMAYDDDVNVYENTEAYDIEATPKKKTIVVKGDAPVVIVSKSTPVLIFDDNGLHLETGSSSR